MMYLVAAYAFAIAVLGGYLAWSLIRVRDLQSPTNAEAKAVSSREPLLKRKQ